MSIKQKFERLIKQERIAKMQIDMDGVLESFPPGLRHNKKFQDSLINSWLDDLKASAFIFGDSYIGIPVEEIDQILLREDFKLAAEEQVPSEPSKTILTYIHSYLNIANVLFVEDNKVYKLNSCFRINIGTSGVLTEKLCGLGVKSLNVNDGMMTGQIDGSESLVAKLTVLKSLVKSDQPEYVFEEI